jgi:hypothetical protein
MKPRRWKAIGYVGAPLLMLAVVHLLGGPPVYVAPPITATVVDASSNRPIANAVVIVDWYMSASYNNGRLFAQEASTDSHGVVHLPSMTRMRPFMGWISRHEPRLSVFSVGYLAWSEVNNANVPLSGFDWEPVRQTSWSDATIRLQKSAGQEDAIDSFDRLLFIAGPNEFINPERAPKTWAMLADEYRKLPESFRAKVGDPEEVIDYYRSGKVRDE